MDEYRFLTLQEVLYLHEQSLQRFGGSSGIGDLGLVESALGSARNAFWYGGADLAGVAAAYAYHIAEAQAFIDGNKRTAVAAAFSFLAANGIELGAENDGSIYTAMIQIARKELDKPGLAELLRTLIKTRPQS